MATMIRWRGWMAILGGILVHVTLGTIYSIGNISPYLISFLRKNTKDTHLTYADGTWWFALAVTAEISMPLGGVIERKIGPRLTTLIGAWIMRYYTQKELLNRVPNCFFILGGIYAGMQLVGCLLLTYPSDEEEAQMVRSESTPQQVASASQHDSVLLLTHIKDDDRTEYFESSTEDEERHTNRYNSVSSSYNRAELASVYASGNDSDLRPFEMLKTRCFYYLWLILFFNSQIFIFIPTLYKAYGMSFITDDKFLATVGAVASISNAAGRIFWGFLMDKTSFKTTMLILNTTLVVLMMTLVITQHGGKPMFLIWIVLIFGTFSGNFSVFPTATTMMFGSKYILINYGILFTATVVTAPVGALLSMTLRTVLGWFGMFCLMSGFAGAGLVLAYLFDDSGQQ